MLQKELAKRLSARYDTKMSNDGWLEVSSDGHTHLPTKVQRPILWQRRPRSLR